MTENGAHSRNSNFDMELQFQYSHITITGVSKFVQKLERFVFIKNKWNILQTADKSNLFVKNSKKLIG